MSVIFFAGRKSAISQKKKVVVRKVGTISEGKEPSMTAAWKLNVNNKKITISFSRDSMNVYVDGSPLECTAYITDAGYDLDLIFNLGDKKGHIYSDVEGTEMTNYLFFDGECIASEKLTNLSSKHQPE